MASEGELTCDTGASSHALDNDGGGVGASGRPASPSGSKGSHGDAPQLRRRRHSAFTPPPRRAASPTHIRRSQSLTDLPGMVDVEAAPLPFQRTPRLMPSFLAVAHSAGGPGQSGSPLSPAPVATPVHSSTGAAPSPNVDALVRQHEAAVASGDTAPLLPASVQRHTPQASVDSAPDAGLTATPLAGEVAGLEEDNARAWDAAMARGEGEEEGLLVTFSQALSTEVLGVLRQAATVSSQDERDELLADLYANVSHEVEPSVAQQVAPAKYTYGSRCADCWFRCVYCADKVYCCCTHVQVLL